MIATLILNCGTATFGALAGAAYVRLDWECALGARRQNSERRVLLSATGKGLLSGVGNFARIPVACTHD